MRSGSSQTATARAWGTSVSARAARSRYSRSMVSLRPWGTIRGGRRSAIRCSPRRTSKSSLEAPPVMKVVVRGCPEPGRSRSSIHRARTASSMRPLVRSASSSGVVAPGRGAESTIRGWPLRARGTRRTSPGRRRSSPGGARWATGRGRLIALQDLAGHRHPVDLGGPSTSPMMGAIIHIRPRGISLETPRAPWTWIERWTMSWRTWGVRTLMAAMS